MMHALPSMRRLSLAAAGAIVEAAAFLACGGESLPAPEYTAQPTSALIEVPYDPPPARVEIIPGKPDHPDAVWIDGEWSWQGWRWAWKRGRWVATPADAKYAPWTTVRNAAGTLFMAPGAWRNRFGVEVAEPAPLAVSKTLPGAIIDPSGAQVQASSIQTKARPMRDASSRPPPFDFGVDDAGIGDTRDVDAAIYPDVIVDPSIDANFPGDQGVDGKKIHHP
jgi:hypothetical protein